MLLLPIRLAAAQDVATTFVRGMPPTINLGLESFAGRQSGFNQLMASKGGPADNPNFAEPVDPEWPARSCSGGITAWNGQPNGDFVTR